MITWKVKTFKADAEKVAKELETIKNATPENIVAYAADETTELHKCFEWDDTKAAAKWRLQQARMIACNIVYTEERNNEPISVRIFHNVDQTKGYEPITILKREDRYIDLLTQAKAELVAFENKYKNLVELEDIFAEIAKL